MNLRSRYRYPVRLSHQNDIYISNKLLGGRDWVGGYMCVWVSMYPVKMPLIKKIKKKKKKKKKKSKKLGKILRRCFF
jgi:hypothetical protein